MRTMDVVIDLKWNSEIISLLFDEISLSGFTYWLKGRCSFSIPLSG